MVVQFIVQVSMSSIHCSVHSFGVLWCDKLGGKHNGLLDKRQFGTWQALMFHLASVLEGNLTAQVLVLESYKFMAQFLWFHTQLIVVMDSFIVSLDLFISGMFVRARITLLCP